MSPDRPASFNLDYLKKTAKHRLRACRAGDAAAIRQLQALLPRLRALDSAHAAASVRLADVQHALALELGFTSWIDLTRHGDPIARLLHAVRGGHWRTLKRQMPEFFGVAPTNVFAAAALGNQPALAAHLERDPALVSAAHERWTPLVYACASPLARFSARHATSLVACAELLLTAGADPDITTADTDSDESMPPTLRAFISGNGLLVAALARRGALFPLEAIRMWMARRTSPGMAELHLAFGEYFRRPEVQAARDQFMSAVKSGGVEPAAFADPLEMQQLRMPNLIGARQDLWAAMLDRGFDTSALSTSGQSALHAAVAYAPVPVVELLLSRGADPNVRDAEGRSVIAAAVRAGNLEVAALLEARGVINDAAPVDRLLGACLAGNAARARTLLFEHPNLLSSLTREEADTLVRAAGRGNLEQVRVMLDLGFDPDARNESGATALHQAAWRGQADVVGLLLDRGARAASRDELYGETPRQWALHGSVHAHGARERCLRVAELVASAER